VNKIKELRKKELKKVLIDNDYKNINGVWNLYKDLVYSIAYTYASTRKVDVNDVKQNSYLCWLELTKSFKGKKMNGDSLEGNYVSYINKYLPKRLNNYWKDYSLFNDYNIFELDRFDEFEFLSPDLIQEDIEDNTLSTVIGNNIDMFTPKEKELYFLLKEGYIATDIADMLEVSDATISEHRKNIQGKIRELVGEGVLNGN
jgi:DNA-directed RNA polymerase specialized sigma subunit